MDIDKLYGWLRDGSLAQWAQGMDWQTFWEDYRLADETRDRSQFALDTALNTMLQDHYESSPSQKLLDLVSFFREKGASPYKVSLENLSDEEYVCVVLEYYFFASHYDKSVVVEMNTRLERAKDVSAWSRGGQSILACALWGKVPTAMVKKLLELGASPFDARTDLGMYKQGRPLLVNQITCVGEVEDIIFDAMVDQVDDSILNLYEPLNDEKRDGLEAAQARKLKQRLQKAIPEVEGKKDGEGDGRSSRKKPL
ncbi:hypothetical protein ACFONN_07040 [Dyella humi]|uniref:Ankyrin repeat domain-containing protein n=1 Tax=Dyella humi TaxID=1770547 RepID=A0ABW8II68_9GAMM